MSLGPKDYVTSGMSRSAIKRWYRRCAITSNDNGVAGLVVKPKLRRHMLAIFNALAKTGALSERDRERYAALRPRAAGGEQ